MMADLNTSPQSPNVRNYLAVWSEVMDRKFALELYVKKRKLDEKISRKLLMEAEFYEEIIKRLITEIAGRNEEKIVSEMKPETEVLGTLAAVIEEEVNYQMVKMRDEVKTQEKQRIEENTKEIAELRTEVKLLKEMVALRREETTEMLTEIENRYQNATGNGEISEGIKGPTNEEIERLEWVEAKGPWKRLGRPKRGKKNITEKIEGATNTLSPVATKMVIRSNKDENVERVIDRVKEVVKPFKESIKVNRIVPIKSGALMEFKTKDEKQEAEIRTELQKMGYEVREPKESPQAIRISGVENEIRNEDIVKELYEKNLKEEKCSLEECEKDIKVIRRYQGRDKRNSTVILTVSHKIRRIIMVTGRVYLGWKRCKAEKYVEVTVCYKCGRLGHPAKICEEEEVCFTCGIKGHKAKDCKKIEAICINCRREGRDKVNHNHKDKNCPIYKKELETKFQKIARSIKAANDEENEEK